jgi:heterodisulfide reductase subunit B
MAVDELKAFALAARNLALAERQDTSSSEVNIVAPCAACYLVLTKAHRYMQEYDEIGQAIGSALEASGMEYEGRVRVRHPLDILVNDIGLSRIQEEIRNPLATLNVACYYGCQVVRPWSTFDDQYNPTSMDRLVEVMGGQPVDWPLKTRCCGGSLTGTIEDVGLRLNHILLREARHHGAQVALTACPLCQFNLECFQKQINRRLDDDIKMPVLYFTQLLGLAMGIPQKTLGMQRSFAPLDTAIVNRKGGELVGA